MLDLLIYFFIGASICFISSLPFGPINLTVAKITIEKNRMRGLEVAAAAAFVEVLQVLIAVWFGLIISNFLENNVVFRVLVATMFVVIGVYIYHRKPARNLNVRADQRFGSELQTGLFVSAINLQAIPFWIIALTLINDVLGLVLQGWPLVLFILGVLMGKMSALTGFIIVSDYLKNHFFESDRWVNHFLGIVLIVIGLLQWANIIWAL